MKKSLLLSVVMSLGLLTGCSSFSPKYHYHEPEPTLQLTLLPLDTIAPGKTTRFQGKITSLETRVLLKDNDFDVRHTQKIHLLIVDPSLTDYQHIHPEFTSTPSVFEFQFTPHKDNMYRVWADVSTGPKHRQEYVSTDIGVHKATTIDRTESHEATVGRYHFVLSFDTPLVAGNTSMGTVTVTDASGGRKVTSLQPLMGAFAHIVGFYDDFRTIVHTHPLGAEPSSDNDRGGPELSFHMMPVKPGFIKLFVQVKINNQELYVPFGLNVTKAPK